MKCICMVAVLLCVNGVACAMGRDADPEGDVLEYRWLAEIQPNEVDGNVYHTVDRWAERVKQTAYSGIVDGAVRLWKSTLDRQAKGMKRKKDKLQRRFFCSAITAAISLLGVLTVIASCAIRCPSKDCPDTTSAVQDVATLCANITASAIG